MIDHDRLVTDQFSVRDYVRTAQSVTVQAARPVPAHHARLLLLLLLLIARALCLRSASDRSLQLAGVRLRPRISATTVTSTTTLAVAVPRWGRGQAQLPPPQIVARPPNLAVLLTHCGQSIPGKKISEFDANTCQILG